MVVWSCLQRSGALSLKNVPKLLQSGQLMRTIQTSSVKLGGHGKQMEIKSSQWQWTKFKDLVHFYIMVGAIPIFSIILYTNIFIGPATLTEIPEGYEPQHWEYYKHPITRFISKYCHPSPQEVYEKKLHKIFEDDELTKIKFLTRKLDDMMANNQDLQVYYYKPISLRNYRRRQEEAEEFNDVLAGVGSTTSDSFK